MNENLTREQADWIRMAVGVARGSNTGIAWAEFYTKLNDYTEDELHPADQWAFNELVKHHQEHHQKIEPTIALQKFREWVNSVPYDVSELMELIAIDILKDYKDWLQQEDE